MVTKIINSLRFRLITIDTKQFALINTPKKGEEIKLESNIRFSADFNKHLISVTPFFRYVGTGPLLQIEVASVFQIEDESWQNLLDVEKNKLTIPKEVAQHFGALAVSTLRGILYEKTSSGERIILPLINLTKIITKDTVLKNNQNS